MLSSQLDNSNLKLPIKAFSRVKINNLPQHRCSNSEKPSKQLVTVEEAKERGKFCAIEDFASD